MTLRCKGVGGLSDYQIQQTNFPDALHATFLTLLHNLEVVSVAQFIDGGGKSKSGYLVGPTRRSVLQSLASMRFPISAIAFQRQTIM